MRSPLSVISGSVKLLARRLQAMHADPAFADVVVLVELAAGRMVSALDEMRDGSLPVRAPRPVDLMMLTQRVVDDHRLLADGRESNVASGAADAVGMWDEGRLTRVLANQLGNALKCSAAVTPISVHVGLEQGGLGAARRDRSGHRHPRHGPATDRYALLSRQQCGKAPGNGIGPTSVHTLVGHHGGTFAVATVEGRGTTVTVRLLLQPPYGT